MKATYGLEGEGTAFIYGIEKPSAITEASFHDQKNLKYSKENLSLPPEFEF